MNKHTPGPWYATVPPSCDIHFIRSIDSDDAGQIAKVRVGPVLEQAEALANARLIATSPELLEMLQKAVKFGGLFPDLAEEARAVIAKATGG